MKRTISAFIIRGMVSSGFGPMVLAVLYLILQNQGVISTLTVSQVCLGIFTLSALSFVAGGMNVIYQIEQLPLMVAILIHGCVLYVCYLLTYLINGWLEWGIAPILAFSGIFLFGYLAIWTVIYTAARRKTAKLNEILRQKQQSESQLP